MKKLLAITLALVMLLSVLSVTAYAANNGPSDKENLGQYYAYITLVNGSNSLIVFRNNSSTDYDDVFYDRSSNTLVLSGFKRPGYMLDANMMGDDFKIRVDGECELNGINIWGDGYGGSLGITGTGKLTVNAGGSRDTGIIFFAESCDVKLNVSDSVSLSAFGEKTPVAVYGTSAADKNGIITVGSKSIESVDGERYTYTDYETIKGAYKSDTPGMFGYKAVSKSDPDGVYSATKMNRWISDDSKPYDEFMEDKGYWDPYIEISKYVYNDYFETYVEDTGFEKIEIHEEDFADSDYSYVMDLSKTPKSIPFYKSDAPLDVDWNYIGYVFNNPDDPNGLWYTGLNMYEDATTADYFYNLSRFEYDEEKDAYVIAETREISIPQFDAEGFSYQMDGSEPKTMLYLSSDDEPEEYLTYLVNNPDDPDGIWGMNNYPYVREDDLFSYGKLAYNEEHQRYEPVDENDEDFISPKEFKAKGYTYVFEQEPVEFKIFNVDVKNYPVYKDKSEKKYAVNWDDKVYDFSEEVKVNLPGGEAYVLSVNDKVTPDELEIIENTVVSDLYNYEYQGKEFVTEGTGAEAPPTEPVKTDISTMTAKLAKTTYTYTGKAIKPSVAVIGLSSSDYTVSYKNNKNAGTATVTITGKGDYNGKITKTFKINKAKQPMKVSTVTKSVKASKLKKSKAAVTKAIKVKNNQGSVTYSKVNSGSSKYLKISSKGVITVAKGKYKKQTLKLKVKVTAKGNSNYKSGSETVIVKIKVK